MALRLDEAGADALVLFNRFLQPDIDPEHARGRARESNLSSRADARLPRRGSRSCAAGSRASLAATGGVERSADVARYLLAGADVVMTASALLRHGPEYAAVLLDGLTSWMARKGFASLDEVRGMLAVPADADEVGVRAGRLRDRDARCQRRRLQPLVNDHDDAEQPDVRPCRHRRRWRRRPGGAAGAAGPCRRPSRPDARFAARLVRRSARDGGRAVRLGIGGAPFGAGYRRRARRDGSSAPTVVAVHADAHRVSCADGTELSFDTLILGPGARLSAPVADAIAFGLEGSGRAIGEMLDRLRSGEARSVAFVAPSTTGKWLLPLYELALMTARELARSNVEGVRAAPPQPGGSASGAVRRSGQPERRSLVGRGGDRVHRLDRGPGGRRLRRHAAAPARPGAGRRTDHAARWLHCGR